MMMKLKSFDVIAFLDSDEALVEYLNVALGKRSKELRQGPSATFRMPRNVFHFGSYRPGATSLVPDALQRRKPPY